MYAFTFNNDFDESVQGILDHFSSWLVDETIDDDRGILDLYYNFDEAGADELYNSVIDSDLFIGYRRFPS